MVNMSECSPQQMYAAVMGKLVDKAASRMDAFNSQQMRAGTWNVDALLSELDRVYKIPQKKEKALRRLQNLKQGTRSFRTYLSDWETTAVSAGTIGWEDSAKILMIENGLSSDLHHALLPIERPADLASYIRLVHGTADRMEAHRRYNTTTMATTITGNSHNRRTNGWRGENSENTYHSDRSGTLYPRHEV